MTITRTDKDKSDATYRELPDGFMGRFRIGKPKLRQVEGKWGPYWVMDFPLTLTESERDRVTEEIGKPPEGVFQSWGPAFGGYSAGWSLKRKKDGSRPTVDFIAAAFGAKNAKTFRDWVDGGACPPEREEFSVEENVAIIEEWVGWIEDMEVYGTIVHHTDERGLLARFGGVMPVGSLPGQPESDYQSFGKGKLRAMVGWTDQKTAEVGPVEAPVPTDQSDPVSQGVAEGVAARDEAQQSEPVGAGAGLNAAQQDRYKELFPDD